ncbi:MAG: c-type cytochrome, partial [Akkermansiaceae bacterium]|nr:c-type cytochrome [Akkermansiaceae bacterium]
ERKNWMWLNYYKIPNGVHVFGRRHKPYGPANYPFELKKLSQMIEIRDRAIWAALAGKSFDIAAADAKTDKLPEVKTNYKPGKKNGSIEYRSGAEVLKTLKVPKGYKIELFADESRFPDLSNPCQISFDNEGRLWVATMPSYPHYRPGDPLPDDKLIILEDTDKDGVADKQTTFADGLHLAMGFEIAHDGVYVSQGYQLIFLADTDGDDQADVREVVMAGFDDHDTHHAISAFCADPSGAFLMGEGTFLHSHVETAYGPKRSYNGGFWRYNPARRKLERLARLSIPNPWGIAYDDWGQDFFLDTSDTNMRWMLPGQVKVGFGSFAPVPPNLLQVKVRPTSGLEFVSSRHFPDEVQGDILLNNTIGFLGTKQHAISDDGAGFKATFRQDLIQGGDSNFRPVDLEFAPDGSLYVVDWHNALIGHMQHNARDPNRDHAHGRIYRVTYPSRPLVPEPKIAGASIPQLLENLKLPEYRARYRTKRELRGRDPEKVIAALKDWARSLDPNDPRYEHHLVEAMWVTWGLDRIEENLVRNLLQAKDFRARAAAVRALRHNGHRIADHAKLIEQAASDPHDRVKVEAVVAASWLKKAEGLSVLSKLGNLKKDRWLKGPYQAAEAALKNKIIDTPPPPPIKTHLQGEDRKSFMRGADVYHKEGHCGTCHQDDGKGLPAAQFPPLAGSEWVIGSEERLIKLTLHGLMGPLEVKGQKYPGQVPMPAFKMLSDQELADVLTFVRNSFGNKASVVKADAVKKVRAATKDQAMFYQVEDLLKEHPME